MRTKLVTEGYCGSAHLDALLLADAVRGKRNGEQLRNSFVGKSHYSLPQMSFKESPFKDVSAKCSAYNTMSQQQTTNNIPRKQRRRPANSTAKTHQCMTCKRKFATRQALLMHEQSHISPVVSIPRPRRAKTPRYRAGAVRGMLTNSPVQAKLIENYIGKRGGGAWAFKALDPCAEQVSGGERIPDFTVSQTAAMELRGDKMIAPPTGLASTDLWDARIVALPFPELPYAVYVRKSGDPWPDQPNTYLTLPSLNSGIANQNNIADPLKLSATPTLGNNCDAFRTTFKGMTVLFNSSDLVNQGMVFAGQMRMDVSDEKFNVASDTEVKTRSFTKSLLDKIPGTTNALVSACSGYYKGKARDGLYMPSRFVQATHKYSSCDYPPLANGDTFEKSYVLSNVNLGFIDSDSTQISDPVDLSPGGTEWYVVSGSDNTQVGVTFFEGMSPQANLDVKIKLGLEAAVTSGSPWWPFIENAPMPDSAALEEFIIIQNQLDVAYPERYNSLGALIPFIGQAVASLAQWGIGKITKWATARYTKPPRSQALVVPEALD